MARRGAPRAPRPACIEAVERRTATRAATWARACWRPWPPSTARSPRRWWARMPPSRGDRRAALRNRRDREQGAAWEANAILGVACFRWPTAQGPGRYYTGLAVSRFYRYVGGPPRPMFLPVPGDELINGGEHLPTTRSTSRGIHDDSRSRASLHRRGRADGREVFHPALKKERRRRACPRGNRRRGRLRPNLSSTRDALDSVLKSIEKARLHRAGDEL